MEEKDTCCAVRSVPPTWVGSADGGEVRLTGAGVVGSSRVLGTAPRSPPELVGCSEGSSEVGGRKRLLWVQQRLPDVGECCVALWAERRVLASFWRLGERFWKVKLGRGGLVQEFAGGGISSSKLGQLFVVLGLNCGESWR